ncbi:MAG: aspartate--tRNA ligase [Candidatus Yanofskybacteria bacterium]|nr:aspartate--tRNA ligase [Candidatus Yanofskybacteria bacterium]
MSRTLIAYTKNKADENVELFGWVHGRRDHGKIIFIDLRDKSGIVQLVFTPQDKELYKTAETLRSEWVLKVSGKVAKRPSAMVNKEIETGDIEVQPESIEVLSEAATPPFALDTDGREIGEENRMKYRYLDLRRERLSKNMALRHRVTKFIRDFFDREGFLEIETPIMTKSTPEGARDYVVPSRLYSGKFYALPQSPQQYKQLLMVAGIEKYFQIARSFRDEDTRGDRQPEFTQMDMEMSFVEREDVMAVNEALLIELIKNVMPNKKIQEIPFPRLTYKEAMEKYKTDRPDLREHPDDPDLLAFCWVIDFPFFEKEKEGAAHFEALAKKWTFTHNPFSAPKPEHMEWLMQKKNIGEILTTQYDIILNGFEIGGGSIRNHKAEALKKVFEILGLDEERITKNFGHMLEAFSYGAPTHGGIAWGLDRLVAILANEPNIREVIAFPKTGDARDLMMNSPSELEEKQLKELHLQIKK